MSIRVEKALPQAGSAAIQCLAQTRRKRDRSSENLGKRWRTLLKIMQHLKGEYGAEVYTSISLPRRGKRYIYTSGDDVLPILRQDIVDATHPADF